MQLAKTSRFFYCLWLLEWPDWQISGITINFKTPSFICVNPRQRNSGVHRCQILCRILSNLSGRRNMPQFRGLQRFDEADGGFPMPHFTENHRALLLEDYDRARSAAEAGIPFIKWHFNISNEFNSELKSEKVHLWEAKPSHRVKTYKILTKFCLPICKNFAICCHMPKEPAFTTEFVHWVRFQQILICTGGCTNPKKC